MWLASVNEAGLYLASGHMCTGDYGMGQDIWHAVVKTVGVSIWLPSNHCLVQRMHSVAIHVDQQSH